MVSKSKIVVINQRMPGQFDVAIETEIAEHNAHMRELVAEINQAQDVTDTEWDFDNDPVKPAKPGELNRAFAWYRQEYGSDDPASLATKLALYRFYCDEEDAYSD